MTPNIIVKGQVCGILINRQTARHSCREASFTMDNRFFSLLMMKTTMHGNFSMARIRHPEPLMVCLSLPVDRDSSVRQLADLPPGWIAWRESVDSPWIRQQHDPANAY